MGFKRDVLGSALVEIESGGRWGGSKFNVEF